MRPDLLLLLESSCRGAPGDGDGTSIWPVIRTRAVGTASSSLFAWLLNHG